MLMPRSGARLTAFAISQSGPVRKQNEDCCFSDDELGLFVVADGMGGHQAGEVASRLAVDSIENFIRRSQDSEDLSWPCGIDPSLSYAGNRVRTAIFLANRRVFRQAESHDDYTGMGTTVVTALVTGARLTIGHVGDSRLYRYSQGALAALTRDDTWAATILAAAVDADPDAVSGHPMQHVLTNVLGAREQPDIHISELTLASGDVLLLCTDGVHNVMDFDALSRLLSNGQAARAVAEGVIAMAIDRKTRDNVTALVVRYTGGSQDV
jgi:serine/threonine protein phosphatase PrpC